MAIKDVVKRIRLEAHLNQREFAEMIKITPVTICLWESGKRSPSFSACRDILAFAKKRKIPVEFEELIKEQ